MKKVVAGVLGVMMFGGVVQAQVVFDMPAEPYAPPMMSTEQIMISTQISEMWQQLFILEESKTIDQLLLQFISQSLDTFEADQGIQG